MTRRRGEPGPSAPAEGRSRRPSGNLGFGVMRPWGLPASSDLPWRVGGEPAVGRGSALLPIGCSVTTAQRREGELSGELVGVLAEH